MHGNAITTNYGMPTLRFYNQFGTLAAQTTATQVAFDGSWLKGSSSCLSNLPIGPYSVDIINATSDGAGMLLSRSKMYLYGSWEQQPIDDPGFFVRQQYYDFLNRPIKADGRLGLITLCSAIRTQVALTATASQPAGASWTLMSFAKINPRWLIRARPDTSMNTFVSVT